MKNSTGCFLIEGPMGGHVVLICASNFVNGGPEDFGLIFTGSEGALQIDDDRVIVSRRPRQSVPDYNIDSWADTMRKRFLAHFRKKYPAGYPGGPPVGQETFEAPPG